MRSSLTLWTKDMERVQYKDQIIEYKLTRSRRRSVGIVLYEDGAVQVRAPFRVSETRIEEFVQQAFDMIPKRVKVLAASMGETYGDIRIKDQKTRWGSCSSKRNLNFNWRLIMAPEKVLDYVIIHELSHLQHMDHSAAFWQRVQQVMPDYQIYRKWLKENGRHLSNIRPGK